VTPGQEHRQVQQSGIDNTGCGVPSLVEGLVYFPFEMACFGAF